MTPHACDPCTSDSECQGPSGLGAGSICSIGNGQCVPSACGAPEDILTTTTVGSACSNANPADICCAGNGGTRCVPGECCSSATCPGGEFCIAHACTSCGAVSDGVYFVDPIGGQNDLGVTGSSGCPFRTIARAIQVINSLGAAAANTRILLRNDSRRATSGESFPLRIPRNVVVRSEDPAMPRTIEVQAERTAFILGAVDSGIASLTIDGMNDALSGVVVSSGSSNVTTTIVDVSISRMGSDGVFVEGGGVFVGPGVRSTANGQNPQPQEAANGLRVAAGNATIQVAAGQEHTGFDANLGSGILVTGNGSITVDGVPDLTGFPTDPNPPAIASGTGTITANGNRAANLAISQTGSTPPLCVLRGLVTWGGFGNGMNVASGSNVVVRDSVSVHNASSGVRIRATFSVAIATASFNIDLGSIVDGNNVFQSTSNANTMAGICIDGAFLNSSQTLSAIGNHFAGHDCASAVGGESVDSSRAGCAGGLDVGIEPSAIGGAQQTNVHVLLDDCASL